MKTELNVVANVEVIKEVVEKIGKSFDMYFSEEKLQAVCENMSVFTCRDRYEHLVCSTKMDRQTTGNMYDVVYMDGSICHTRSDLIKAKLSKLELPSNVDGVEVDILTVITVYAALFSFGTEDAMSQLKVLSVVLDWMYKG